jgi:tRNA (guanine26-N2/guanine27-N2)-dimethyltransferase
MPDMEYAGPLWLGELHDSDFISKMKKINEKRKYGDMDEISSMLDIMETEVGMPPYYYNVHAICKIKKLGRIPNMNELIEKIRNKGYRANRTHFSNISIKTDAPYETVLEAV